MGLLQRLCRRVYLKEIGPSDFEAENPIAPVLLPLALLAAILV